MDGELHSLEEPDQGVGVHRSDGLRKPADRSVAALKRDDDGVDLALPAIGKVLGPMVKRIAPDAKVTSVVTIEDIEAIAKELA